MLQGQFYASVDAASYRGAAKDAQDVPSIGISGARLASSHDPHPPAPFPPAFSFSSVWPHGGEEPVEFEDRPLLDRDYEEPVESEA